MAYIRKIIFPSRQEQSDPLGVTAVTKHISAELLYNAYVQGLFPWPWNEEFIPWCAPPLRAVLKFKNFHIPKRLKRYLKKCEFSFKMNTCFKRVIEKCASVPRKNNKGTWITPDLIRAYCELYKWGYAWSGECFNQGGELVGGIYGVIINNIPKDYFSTGSSLLEIPIPNESNRNSPAGTFAYISGESMFHTVPHSSKFALIRSVQYFQSQKFEYMDIQALSPLTKMFGARNITDAEFRTRTRPGLLLGCTCGSCPSHNSR